MLTNHLHVCQLPKSNPNTLNNSTVVLGIVKIIVNFHTVTLQLLRINS